MFRTVVWLVFFSSFFFFFFDFLLEIITCVILSDRYCVFKFFNIFFSISFFCYIELLKTTNCLGGPSSVYYAGRIPPYNCLCAPLQTEKQTSGIVLCIQKMSLYSSLLYKFTTLSLVILMRDILFKEKEIVIYENQSNEKCRSSLPFLFVLKGQKA